MPEFAAMLRELESRMSGGCVAGRGKRAWHTQIDNVMLCVMQIDHVMLADNAMRVDSAG